jgi:hypothetical protein
MAGYRQFHTKFWKDEWLIELEPLERYLFAYLFTNELSSISGIYKIPLKVMVNETGLTIQFVNQTLAKFQAAKKIFYRDGVMWVVSMKKYHRNASPKTMSRVNNDINDIPDCDVKIAYLYYEETGIYRIDTVSIPNLKANLNLKLNLNKDKAKDKANLIGGENDSDDILPEDDQNDEEPQVSPLSDAFTTATGIVPYKLEQWTEAAQTMTRAGVLVDEIKQAIKKMQDDGLTISHLKSVVAVAIDIHSKRERGVPINNGQKKEETELEKVIRLGEERKQRIRAEQFGVAK